MVCLFHMIVTYLSTLVPLVILDACWLLLVAKPFYSERIGHLMATQPTWWPVLLFYPLYAFGITLFVLLPHANAPLTKIALLGICFGAIAYATYDLTNHATLKNWPLSVTMVDIVWGACVTGIVAIIATVITKYLSA